MEINVNNVRLSYIKEGEGKPLILMHGSGEDRHIFDEIINKLKKDFTVYAIDSRNHGESEKTDVFTYEAMSEDISEFIKKLKLDGAYVVGFSDGAILALMTGMKYPELIGKMALLGINLKPEDFKEPEYNYLLKEYNETKDPLFKMMLEQPDIELGKLKDVNIPALVIAGENDVFYEKTFTDIVKVMPNAVLKIMGGHDHSSYVINQDILYTDFLEFF